MAKVKVGDLVCMHRRKKKGLGIVLEQTSDIIESAGVEGMSFKEFHERLREIDSAKHQSHGALYSERKSFRDTLTQKAARPDLIETSLLYNSSWARKPKKEFVRIRWFDRPSLYENNQTNLIEEWCPTEWLRIV